MRISNVCSIRNIMYLSKNCEKSAQFFVDVLGKKIIFIFVFDLKMLIINFKRIENKSNESRICRIN